ncbi:MAG: hypothetical protein LBD10_06165 [Desulfobulbus sp.]|uniref:hypothetical protein n=1 Tax=Desulfobulbus sp. TaxID=895 RepID=UPI002841D989|nr:hypothetical protein [Desulfobulbus sp.]MDR2549763.1 hypothetical protein [Desulfobulbus sp.]
MHSAKRGRFASGRDLSGQGADQAWGLGKDLADADWTILYIIVASNKKQNYSLEASPGAIAASPLPGRLARKKAACLLRTVFLGTVGGKKGSE